MASLIQTQPVIFLSIASWFVQHGIELLVVLAGLVMGLIFVIGWRGSAAKEISLKNDPRVKALLYGYFKDKKFKSFICLTVIGNGEVIGVVNMESSQELGAKETQNQIAKVLQPFCAILRSIRDGPLASCSSGSSLA